MHPATASLFRSPRVRHRTLKQEDAERHRNRARTNKFLRQHMLFGCIQRVCFSDCIFIDLL